MRFGEGSMCVCDLVHVNYDSVFELSGVVILKK